MWLTGHQLAVGCSSICGLQCVGISWAQAIWPVCMSVVAQEDRRCSHERLVLCLCWDAPQCIHLAQLVCPAPHLVRGLGVSSHMHHAHVQSFCKDKVMRAVVCQGHLCTQLSVCLVEGLSIVSAVGCPRVGSLSICMGYNQG